MISKFLTHTSSLLLLGALFLFGCGPEQKEKPEEAPKPAAKTVPAIAYSLVKTYPHDTSSYTEGFLFHDGKLFESSANNWSTSGNGNPAYGYIPTKSGFGIADLEKGTLDIKSVLDEKTYFAEGIVFLNDKVYQVTYKNQKGFIYDAKTFKQIGQFNYQNKEGWGLTTDGKSIIMSDGTYNLTFLNPADLKVEKTIGVTEMGYGLDHINELEYINGYIYANVWMTNYIVKIDPATGEVLGKIDLDDLNVKARSVAHRRTFEMNGIAYDPASDRILVTGKLWPNVFEISFPH